MAKSLVTVNIDSDVIETIRAMNVNISREVNDYLKSYISSQSEDAEGLDINLTRLQLEKNIKKLNHYQAAVKACQAKIERFEERKKEKEEMKIKEEKEALELAMRCVGCGQIIPEIAKKHMFSKGPVCNACFMTADADKYRKWNE